MSATAVAPRRAFNPRKLLQARETGVLAALILLFVLGSRIGDQGAELLGMERDWLGRFLGRFVNGLDPWAGAGLGALLAVAGILLLPRKTKDSPVVSN